MKPRSKEYVSKHIHDFVVCKLDDILRGSIELKNLGTGLEIGAYCIFKDIEKNDIATISTEMIGFAKMFSQRTSRTLISLTNHPGLQRIYINNAGNLAPDNIFSTRREQSPGVEMFVW